ncbi:hypothetical protein BDA99DRAFT_252182 [Phascolomyces articulosus]|uniref:Uncharacterized protein n=1 Tax=Phascolomyces articulosus TaxID=60185 RepID=A0AAD5PA49_9FUNG|nr:hypothetical protein BDA99DRAFT_252182 [Phascolomyces articulosus]
MIRSEKQMNLAKPLITHGCFLGVLESTIYYQASIVGMTLFSSSFSLYTLWLYRYSIASLYTTICCWYCYEPMNFIHNVYYLSNSIFHSYKALYGRFIECR